MNKLAALMLILIVALASMVTARTPDQEEYDPSAWGLRGGTAVIRNSQKLYISNSATVSQLAGALEATQTYRDEVATV